jgi:hypothetical protein
MSHESLSMAIEREKYVLEPNADKPSGDGKMPIGFAEADLPVRWAGEYLLR